MTTAILTRPTTEAKPPQRAQPLPFAVPSTQGAIRVWVELEQVSPERDEDGAPFCGFGILEVWIQPDGKPLGNRIRDYVSQEFPGWRLQPGPDHPGWYTGPVCDEF